ncbi:DoxX family protein [Ferruginibacter paludis]|uniref:DoxX family protein n=1 Tax=Ferruginibacter paludis TaxID=1310417 RepID=UPI0025B3D06C|nr:DoxX family protein [Ferruginibacter paludis]MDN3657735.1 DoxX family protein [Ferruginibacter paludis]
MKSLFSPIPSNTKSIIAVLRIIIGAMMIYHGAEVFNPVQMKEYAQWDMFKNSGSPALMPYIGKSAEFLCGLLLLLGLFTRISALMLIISMAYITFKIGHGKFWYEDQHPFMFVLFGLLFFFTGPGKWSLDHVLFKPKAKYTTYK